MKYKSRSSHRLLAAGAAIILFAAPIAESEAGQSWSPLTPGGTPPAARNGHSAVYDPVSNQMIVFGGARFNIPDSCNDHWRDLWSLSDANGIVTPAWSEVAPAGGPPCGRFAHRASYDEANDRMIVFGGIRGRSSPCANDVWVLSNASSVTPTWSFLTSGGPAPRAAHSQVYDPDSNKLIVFGGNNCSSSPSFGDLWVLSNASGLGGAPAWAVLGQSGSAPGLLAIHTAVYDSANNRMIVFGGQNPGHTSNVWVLTNADGTGVGTPTWSLLGPGGTPPDARLSHSAVYDAAANEMIVFGGQTSGGDVNDVWVLSDANGIGVPAWTELSPSGTPPSVRGGHSAVFDPSSNRMTIFGGGNAPFLNDVWALSLTVFSCAGDGFESPFGDTLTLKNKTKRAIPVQMVLEESGAIITDEDVAAPPVVNVSFAPTGGGGDSDVTAELLPLGQANDDNIFRFDTDELKWIYNLGTKPFLAPGTYTVTAVAGDPSYMIDSSCTGNFVRLD